MSAQDTTSGRQPTEEELRAAYEAELKRLKVEHVVVDQIVSLINLGMRKTGLAPGTEDERDLAQVKLAIDSVRALVPLIEPVAGAQQVGPIRDALSQLQLAFVRLGGAAGAAAGEPTGSGGGAAASGGPSGPEGGPGGQGGPGAGESGGPQPPRPGEPGPAQRSGRLWVPGQ